MSAAGTRIERRSHASDPRPSLEEIEARTEEEERLEPIDGEVDDKGGGADDPEKALAEAHRVIEQQDEQLRQANDRAARAETTAGQTAVQNLDNQERAFKANLDTAKSSLESAKAKYRTAVQDGNVDDQIAAQEDIGRWSGRLDRAEDTLNRFDAWKKGPQGQAYLKQATQPRTEQRTTQPPAGEPTPEARKFLADHPLYFSRTEAGQDYQANALAAHEAAIVELGRDKEGSADYIRYIDQKLEGIYGKGHGQLTKGKAPVTTTQRRSSTAAPPSRQSSGGDGGDFGDGQFDYTHKDGSRLRLTRGTDPKTGEPFEKLQGTIPAEWREFARVNKMTDIKFATEQMKIQEEIKNGGRAAGLAHNLNGVYV